MERLGMAVVRTYSLGLSAVPRETAGDEAKTKERRGRTPLGQSGTRQLGTPYVGHLHRLSVNRGQKAFGAVWRSLPTISTIVCRWCNTLVLSWYAAGVVLVLIDASSELFEEGCFCACFHG
jgi:hypothetical protein